VAFFLFSGGSMVGVLFVVFCMIVILLVLVVVLSLLIIVSKADDVQGDE
jgi:uncharacterized membrane protein